MCARQQVFDALWATLSVREAAASSAGPLSRALDPDEATHSPGGLAQAPASGRGWLSLRALAQHPGAAKAAFAGALGPFLAGEGWDPPGDPPALARALLPPRGAPARFARSLCFLPPRQHLLLRLECQGSADGGNARVRIATDFGPCMAWVDDLLDEVFAGEEG